MKQKQYHHCAHNYSETKRDKHNPNVYFYDTVSTLHYTALSYRMINEVERSGHVVILGTTLAFALRKIWTQVLLNKKQDC
jgi:hypothetical protein